MPLSRTVARPLLHYRAPSTIHFWPHKYAVLLSRDLRIASKAARLAANKRPRQVRPEKLSSDKQRPTQTSNSAVPPANDPSTTSDPSGVNFFEVNAGEDASRKRRVQDPDAGLDSLEKTVNELDEAVEDIDNALGSTEVPTEAGEDEVNDIFSEGELADVESRMLEAFQSQKGEMEDIQHEYMPHAVMPSQDMPLASRLFLSKLNDALNDASMDASNPEASKLLWRYYERAKIYIPNLLKLLPDPAWQLLWITQSDESAENSNRAAHLKTLSLDMAKAGRKLTEEQRFARLEGIFWDGKQDEALHMWEEGLENGDARNTEFLELGIRMYAYDRRLDRSLELVDVLFKLHPKADPRIFLQLIEASIGIGTEDEFKRAWDMYGSFRKRLSSSVTLEDYDRISVAFLRANQKDYAFAVFRDMMLADEIKKTESGLQGALKRFSALLGSAEQANEVNAISLESLTFLPRRFQNKFFYASWLKKLIGMGEVDSAGQVLDLMYERGVKPDAKHVNGIINVRLNAKSKSGQKYAEELAWSMIQKRIDFVNNRDGSAGSSATASIYVKEDSISKPLDLPRIDRDRPIPQASIETFCLLVQYYLRRSMMDNVRHLRDLLVTCQIPMNAYFMNHLLFAELRHRTYREVWSRFKVMSQTVKPDTETFSCLWDCMDTHVNPVLNDDPYGFPTPKELFRVMLAWMRTLQGQQLRDAKADTEAELYDNIVRCFCLSNDLVGAFVVLHALHCIFRLTPHPGTLRMLTVEIARLTLPKAQIGQFRKSRKLDSSKQREENIMRTTHVLATITEMRTQAYQENGLTLEQLDDEQLQEEQLRIALQLVYTGAAHLLSKNESNDVDYFIKDAAEELGIEAPNIEQCMALVV